MRTTSCRMALLFASAIVVSANTLAAQGTSAATGTNPTPAVARKLPADRVANAEIDAGFINWSAAWMFDRYVPGSSRVTDRGLTGETYVVRGLFDFYRSGQKITIPFAAAYKSVDGAYAMSNLCYNDLSTTMTDCINPSDNLEGRRAGVAQSRQLLGSIVLLGLAAAMTQSDGDVCYKRYTIFGELYVECP